MIGVRRLVELTGINSAKLVVMTFLFMKVVEDSYGGGGRDSGVEGHDHSHGYDGKGGILLRTVLNGFHDSRVGNKQ